MTSTPTRNSDSHKFGSYVSISSEDMDRLLSPLGFQVIEVPGTREIVYGKRVDRNGLQLSLRVYTSLEPGVGSREVGKDAIRVSVHWRYFSKQDSNDRSTSNVTKIARVGTSKRVNRVPGWEDRLKERVSKWEEMLGPGCPKCGSPTALRKSKRGEFYGCVRFPDCRGTMETGK